ncbi:MAG: tRNA-binding protein [Vulcanimicrobiaceae bacterium]
MTDAQNAPQADSADFARLDIRAGTIRDARLLAGARKPAYRLEIDFGPALGLKRSSAQLVALYEPATLVGRQVIAVVNFPPRRIAGFTSDVLVLGLAEAGGAIVLVAPERPVADGARLC